jgi:hypothetical protein
VSRFGDAQAPTRRALLIFGLGAAGVFLVVWSLVLPTVGILYLLGVVH